MAEVVGEATITIMVEILDMVQEEVVLITILIHLEISIMFLVAAMKNNSVKYVVNMVILRLIAIIVITTEKCYFVDLIIRVLSTFV